MISTLFISKSVESSCFVSAHSYCDPLCIAFSGSFPVITISTFSLIRHYFTSEVAILSFGLWSYLLERLLPRKYRHQLSLCRKELCEHEDNNHSNKNDNNYIYQEETFFPILPCYPITYIRN